MRLFRGIRKPDGSCHAYVVGHKGQVRPLPLFLKLWNHSPDGFNWGYGGSGPAQLALAILATCLSKSDAVRYHQRFKWEFVANFPHEAWQLSELDVRLAVLRYSAPKGMELEVTLPREALTSLLVNGKPIG